MGQFMLGAKINTFLERANLKPGHDKTPKAVFEKPAASVVGVVPQTRKIAVRRHYSAAELFTALSGLRQASIALHYPDHYQAINGLSFFGGYPILPHALRWPYAEFHTRSISRREPMHFIGQIDFSALQPLQNTSYRLPNRGILYIFVHASQKGWYKSKGRVVRAYQTRVLFAQVQDREFQMRPAPAEMPAIFCATPGAEHYPSDLPNGVFPNRPIMSKPVWSVPSKPALMHYLGQNGTDPEFSQGDYLMATNHICGEYNAQNPKKGAFLLGFGKNTPSAAFIEDLNTHMLLFQLNTDPGMNWLWGEEGTSLQFWIKPEHLAAQDFSNVIAIC